MLTELQQLVLKKIFEIELIRGHFYLTAGTALSAYYYHHRISDDLDLFTHDIEIDSIEPIIVDALKNFTVEKTRSSPTFRRYKINGELQLDLVRDVDFRVGTPLLIDNVMVDNLKNIAVNKVLAIYGRLDAKDYIDLFFLIKNEKFSIVELLKLASQKDGGLEAFQWSRVIEDADSLTVLPKMLKKLDLEEIRKFFKNLRDEVVDSINPKK